MSSTRKRSIKTLDWEHRYAAIFKCPSKSSAPAEALDPTEIVVADDSDINNNENLRRILAALQRDLVFKQIYPFAKKPTTNFLNFRQYQDDQPNQAQQLLNALIAATRKEDVEAQAIKLARRYMGTKYIQSGGVLIFLVAQGKYEKKAEGECLFVFKCDFEAISQLTEKRVFRKIEDAIVEKAKKGALYPYYEDGVFDNKTVRVFDEFGETQYWLEFLELGERPPEYQPLQAVTVEEWERIRPGASAKYDAELKELSSGRSLTTKDLFTQPADRLSLEEVERLIAAVTARTGKQTITLQLDRVKITVPLDEYGRSWILAEQAGTRFVLLKGFNLEMRSEMLNPVDLGATLDLRQAVEKLNIPV
jgi:Protein of unknown function (DUF3900)